MKIALFGASGTLGTRIAREALDRGHDVTAIARNVFAIPLAHPNLKFEAGNAIDAGSVAALSRGHDVILSAIGPRHGDSPGALLQAAPALINGTREAHVKRLVVVGGAGSLLVGPGQRLVDQPYFHKDWKPAALAHAEALEILRASDVNWTFISPAGMIEPGQRTGKYRLGTDNLLTDAQGKSYISAEDFALAVVDELEHPQFERRRFTAAY